MTKVELSGGREIFGNVAVPGDKSISHRALLLSALADGTSSIAGISQGADVQGTAKIVEQLGATVTSSQGLVNVIGPAQGLQPADSVLDCGNSGTTARLLMGLVSAIPGSHVIDGDASLRGRPMERVRVPLEQMGVRVDYLEKPDCVPLCVRGVFETQGITYAIPHASAQVKSAILFAGLASVAPVVIEESIRTRSNTEEMMRNCGIDVEWHDQGNGRVVRLRGGRPHANHWRVPGDPSQAAFFVVAALLASPRGLSMTDIYLAEERRGFIDVLLRMGGSIEVTEGGVGASLSAKMSYLRATDIDASEIPSVDEVPILVVAAAAATGASRFSGMGELRLKESDRFTESISLARKLGAEVSIEGDDFIVQGLGSAAEFGFFSIETSKDHRMAMAAAIAGAVGSGCEILGADSVETSFPGFFQTLAGVST